MNDGVLPKLSRAYPDSGRLGWAVLLFIMIHFETSYLI